MSEKQNAPGIEFLVHGKLGPCLVVPGDNSQALELWVVPTPEMETFSALVAKQSGATILGNHLWFFRPIDIPVQEDGKTVVMKKMLALDAGCFPDEELRQIRKSGVKVRRHPSTSDPLSGFLIVTSGDVMDFTTPITFSQVQFSSPPASDVHSSDERTSGQDEGHGKSRLKPDSPQSSSPGPDKVVETTYIPPPRSKIQVQPSVIEGNLPGNS